GAVVRRSGGERDHTCDRDRRGPQEPSPLVPPEERRSRDRADKSAPAQGGNERGEEKEQEYANPARIAAQGRRRERRHRKQQPGGVGVRQRSREAPQALRRHRQRVVVEDDPAKPSEGDGKSNGDEPLEHRRALPGRRVGPETQGRDEANRGAGEREGSPEVAPAER